MIYVANELYYTINKKKHTVDKIYRRKILPNKEN